MKTIERERDLLSTGKLCELLQATPNRIERAAELAGVSATLRLNGLSYWDDAGVEAIRSKLAERTGATDA